MLPKGQSLLQNQRKYIPMRCDIVSGRERTKESCENPIAHVSMHKYPHQLMVSTHTKSAFLFLMIVENGQIM